MQRAAERLGEAAGQKSGSRGPTPSLAVFSYLPAHTCEGSASSYLN